MPDTIEELAYTEAQRGLALQVILLNELRARTGILLAVTAATGSFLGAAAINRGGLHAWGVLAIAAFAITVGCCLGVLWPHRSWGFYQGAAGTLHAYRDSPKQDESGDAWTLAEAMGDLALHMEADADAAQETMKGMQQLFMAAGIGLGFQVAFWLVEYGTT